jgi:antitoxin CcdA
VTGAEILRAKVSLSLDETLSREVRDPGLNMSRIAEASRLERNRRWREENRAALDACAREAERDGTPLARLRGF